MKRIGLLDVLLALAIGAALGAALVSYFDDDENAPIEAIRSLT